LEAFEVGLADARQAAETLGVWGSIAHLFAQAAELVHGVQGDIETRAGGQEDYGDDVGDGRSEPVYDAGEYHEVGDDAALDYDRPEMAADWPHEFGGPTKPKDDKYEVYCP
jgi:hypothetical protein